jgi:hypothetical protein
MKDANEGVAIAALSLAVVEVFRIYRETAPSLADMRRAQPYDYATSQLVLDADMLGIIVVVAIGGGAAYLTRQLYPLLLGGIALFMISAYYRSVLRSTNEGMK